MSATRQFRRLVIEPLEGRVLLAVGTVELGPSDNIALDQPRVAVELALDTDPDPAVERWESIGPSIFNTFLLDTGANSVLAMATAVADMLEPPLAYETEGLFVEVGVGGPHPMDISAPYRFDFAGTSGIRNTLLDTRILSDPDKDFSMLGPWGIVGMPGMANRVTSMDMRGWSGGGLGLDDLYMKSNFSDHLPPENGHRYALSVDNRVSFDPMSYLVSGEPPVWADIPFLTAIPQYQGVGEPGNFLFDTGAQISFISRHLAIQIGLDSNFDGLLDQRDAAYVGTEAIGGVGGATSVPVFAIDEVRVPVTKVSTGEEVELVWTDLQWLVLDIDLGEGKPPLDGVFGSDLLTSGWFHAFFYPGSPDGYIDQVHLDFRDWDLFTGSMEPRSGTVYFDLNPAVDEIILPGPGIRIRETARSTEVIKGVSTDTYSIALQTVPSAPVEITLTAQSPVLLSADGGATFGSTLVLTLRDTKPATITVASEDGGLVTGPQNALISHTVSSGDADYHAMPVRDVSVLVLDDRNLVTFTSDAAGENVISSIDVAEGDDAVQYWIRLSEPVATETWMHVEDPDGQVVVVNPHNIGEGFENVWMFGAGNWSTPQPVRLTAVEDPAIEGPHQTQLVHTVLNLSGQGDPIVGQSLLTVHITDGDVGAVIVTATGDGTRITEGGATDSYQIALATTPLGAVQIELTADSRLLLSGDGGITFAPTLVLTFHDSTPQWVTVQAVDDDVAEGTHTGRITHAITGEILDPSYPSWLTIADVTAGITDDDSAGVSLADDPQGEIAITSIDVIEGGGEVLYWVSLTSRPKHEVTIFLGDADGQLTAVDDTDPGNAFLVFAPLDWNVPQAVRVAAVDDGTVEGARSVSLVHSLLSNDPLYQGSVLLAVNITEDPLNEPPGIGSLRVAPDPVTRPAAITLTAEGASDPDGVVARVAFYLDTNRDGVWNENLDQSLGLDEDGADGWTRTVDTGVLTSGRHTVFARAQDDRGAWSDTVSATVLVRQGSRRDGNAPTATLHAPDVDTAGGATYRFTVTFADNWGVNASTLGDADVRVRGPGMFQQQATLVSVDLPGNDVRRTATYQITAPGGAWSAEDSGVYEIWILPLQVADMDHNYASFGRLGTFTVTIDPSHVGEVPPEPVAQLSDDRFELVDGQLRLRTGRSLAGEGPTMTVVIVVPDTRSPDNPDPMEISTTIQTSPWQNPVNPLDVNGDGKVLAFDALLVINWINANRTGTMRLVPAGVEVLPPFPDVDGDHRLLAFDILLVINYLNRPRTSGSEGESAASLGLSLDLEPAPTAGASSLLSSSSHTTGDPHRVMIRTRGGGTVAADSDSRTETARPGVGPDHFGAASRDRWRVLPREAPTRNSTELETLLEDIGDAIAAHWARWR